MRIVQKNRGWFIFFGGGVFGAGFRRKLNADDLQGRRTARRSDWTGFGTV